MDHNYGGSSSTSTWVIFFAVQEEIARQISEKLQMRLSGEEEKRSPSGTPKTPGTNCICRDATTGTSVISRAPKRDRVFRTSIEVIRTTPGLCRLADSFIILGFNGLMLDCCHAWPRKRPGRLWRSMTQLLKRTFLWLT